jgi:hypothetical protein
MIHMRQLMIIHHSSGSITNDLFNDFGELLVAYVAGCWWNWSQTGTNTELQAIDNPWVDLQTGCLCRVLGHTDHTLDWQNNIP